MTSSSCFDALRTSVQPDEQAAILHHYFGALGGDPGSQMALGYRHLTGLGVPKNCWSAVAYYQPVAEQVVQLAMTPGSLPQLEKIRLHVQAAQV
jgi:SEL1 protein